MRHAALALILQSLEAHDIVFPTSGGVAEGECFLSASKILVVEDEAAQCRIIADILRKRGYAVREASNGEQALSLMEQELPELVLSDWRMPGMSGGELLAEVRRRQLSCAFVVMTAYGSISHAVQALQAGANDYLAKPFEREALLLAVERVLRTASLERENRQLREQLQEQSGFGELIGQAPAMQRVYKILGKVAATDATVLIRGESGTGKELVARTLHQRSQRSGGAFVALNCAAVPETLMESELFGFEKGAFTGAERRREGKFEEAQNGTLFLDEISAMSLPLQATLLRVLQERSLTRLGGRGEVALDVRIIAAANRDLQQMVADGRFREDLFYRLNVVPLELPPLRHRREDIPLLANFFFERHSIRYDIEVKPFPPPVLKALMEYGWPGNVRQLANVMERLVLLVEDGKVQLEDLPSEIRNPSTTPGCPFRLPPDGLIWEEMEAGLLSQALELCSQNRTAAARLVGLNYKAFLYRLEKYGLV